MKSKQRELTFTINELKTENEAIIGNADSEIKRLSDFVDKITTETDRGKKQLTQDYELKLMTEKKKNEELRQKMHSEQNEIERKLDELQQEI